MVCFVIGLRFEAQIKKETNETISKENLNILAVTFPFSNWRNRKTLSEEKKFLSRPTLNIRPNSTASH